MAQNWTGTKQRNDLKTCPFCDTAAVQQVRLADSDTDMQFRIGCGNSFCLVEPNTPPFAALRDAEWAWQDRPALTEPQAMSADHVELEARLRGPLKVTNSRQLRLTVANALADLRKQRDEALMQDEPTFTHAFKVRAEAAEARAASLKAQLAEARTERDSYLKYTQPAILRRAEAAERDRDRYKALAEGERKRIAKFAKDWRPNYKDSTTPWDIDDAILALPPPALDGAEKGEG